MEKTSYSFLALFHLASREKRWIRKGGSVTGRDLPVWNGDCPSITLPQLRIFRQRNAVRYSKIFDSQMALLPPLQIYPYPPFISLVPIVHIHTYIYMCIPWSSLTLSPRVSTSLSIRLPFLFLFSLNRITGLFFQPPWIEPEAVYSHVMERRLPRNISTLIFAGLRMRLDRILPILLITEHFQILFHIFHNEKKKKRRKK